MKNILTSSAASSRLSSLCFTHGGILSWRIRRNNYEDTAWLWLRYLQVTNKDLVNILSPLENIEKLIKK